MVNFKLLTISILSTTTLLSLSNPLLAQPKGSSPVVSSDTANSSYKTVKFTTLPEKQLKSRMPIDRVKAPLNSPASNPIIGTPGAAKSSGNPSDSPSSFGASSVPFSTSRVLGNVFTYPYRATGKLYMAFGGTTYNSVCSASLIGRSLVVTAAHCVHNYGQQANGWARRVKFVPTKSYASEVFGAYETSQYIIPTVYYNGTDTCTQTGVVCNNDIAVISLPNNSAGQQAGNLAGFYNYGWNGYSYAVPAAAYQGVFGNKLFASITQLGYPASHDSGLVQQSNTAYGAFFGSGNLKNTWLGSAMTGGSSGGPWLVNLGIDAVGANYGSANIRNVVVGVTSYGNGEQRQGSSWFGQNVQFPNAAYGSRGAGNIGALVYYACDDPSFGWNLQNLGRCR
jgi:hypothetical protein